MSISYLSIYSSTLVLSYYLGIYVCLFLFPYIYIYLSGCQCLLFLVLCVFHFHVSVFPPARRPPWRLHRDESHSSTKAKEPPREINSHSTSRRIPELMLDFRTAVCLGGSRGLKTSLQLLSGGKTRVCAADVLSSRCAAESKQPSYISELHYPRSTLKLWYLLILFSGAAFP